MFEVNKRDKKLIELYQVLTKSNFKGEWSDNYVIELLFTTMCLDVTSHSKTALELTPQQYIDLAKEVIRIVEVDDGLDIYSIYHWSLATLKYIKENSLSVKDVHKMSTFDLKEAVRGYLELE